QESQALSALDRTLLFRNQLGSAREGQGPYPIESVPYLAIGDIHDARNIPKLLAANVGAVLNLSDFEGSFEKYAASGIAYQKIDCLDMPGFPIIAKSFPTARMFMDGQVQRGKRILVHCSMGINRSATICVAYLMVREGMPVAVAAGTVQSARRHPILTNPGFRRQLARLAVELGVG
ncbi:unnamed protein product, partial [Prorocentrum cordatum]